MTAVQAAFGDIDIYLFDQILRGRIRAGMRVFDAGCGGGRNLVYFLREGFDVRGIDASADAIAATRGLALSLTAGLSPQEAAERFTVATLEANPAASASADVVIASAVLHFARDDRHFAAMVDECWRVVAPGGLFFARLASTAGIEQQVLPLGDHRFRLPDGSDRYLVDEPRLLATTKRLGGTLADPLKTTLVHGLRSMTTWVVHKRA